MLGKLLQNLLRNTAVQNTTPTLLQKHRQRRAESIKRYKETGAQELTAKAKQIEEHIK